MKRRLTALLLVLLCLPLTACQKQQNLYSATWFDLFDTVAIVQGYADSQDSWNAQTQAVYSDLQRYNELFDIYHHYDGVINLYDVNARAAAAPVQVSDELYAFLRWCKDTAYPAANGATNIAAGAVLRLWHDARESDSPVPPDADAIAAALAADGLGYVDWNCYTGDGLPGVLTTEKAYQNAVSSVGEQKIVVMLMHDYSAATLEALPDIIDTLKAKGYMMMPLFRESVMIRSA